MKRNLIADIRQSQTNALLELLGHYGVTVDGATGLQNAPSAFLKQLAAFIESGNFSNETAALVFSMFNTVVGGATCTVDVERPFHELGGGIDDDACRALMTVISSRTIDCQFVLMDLKDFGNNPSVSLSQVLNNEWRHDWCSKNLVGFKLGLCPQDSAPYIVSECKSRMIGGELLIVSSSLSSTELQLFAIEFRNDREPWLTLRRHRHRGGRILFRVEPK